MAKARVNEETGRRVGMRQRFALVLGAGLAALAVWGITADSSQAKSAVLSFDSEPSTTQAGGHPDINSTFVLGHKFTQGPLLPCLCNDPKDVLVKAPAGVVANPHVVSVCTTEELVTATCSADSQVGLVVLNIVNYIVLPLYRTTPQAGQASLFQFQIPLSSGITQYLSVTARTGSDYGLNLKVLGLNHFRPVDFYGTVFWGVPGAAKNDLLRFAPGQRSIFCGINPTPFVSGGTLPPGCETVSKAPSGSEPKTPVPSSLPVQPFTQAPTTCSGPLSSTIETFAYDYETDSAEAPWPATTGCDLLTFNPSLSANPTTTQADTASGIATNLKVPQFQDAGTPSPSEIRATTIELPEGLTINPNAADGKVTCSDEEARFGSEEPAQCPEFAKVGTVTLDSSALPGPIHGFAYLGDPEPGNPYRVILTANGFATAVKLEGTVNADPQTGQLTISFVDLPQAPFQDFDLHIFGSERGLLATPEKCGTYAVDSTFVPWAAELSNQTSRQFFTVDAGPEGAPCPGDTRPFDPHFEAGSEDNTAAAHSTFALTLDRNDGDQNLTGADVSTPPGFLAKLKGIPYCPESAIGRLAEPNYAGAAEVASSACPAASQIGTAVAGAGAGTHPIFVPGKVYLSGPYKGAPLSLLIVVPAVSGPYDLGVVTVRTAVNVDPVTAKIRAVSDPLPQILEGIPFRTRFIKVSLDRPQFALNPTNCNPSSVDVSVHGDEGAFANRSARFQAANCTDLAFGPKLNLKLSGGLKRLGHPAIRAELSTRPGEANIRRASVTLPKGELLDNSHIRTICTRVAFAQEACPAASLIGHAEARSPLLDEPLRGAVYLRSSDNKLPDIVIDLDGQIDIELVGEVDSPNGRLRTTFSTVPDAPVSSFVLRLLGGSKGLVVNSESLCGASKRAAVRMTGQNGAVMNSRTKLQTTCGSKARHKRRAQKGKAGH